MNWCELLINAWGSQEELALQCAVHHRNTSASFNCIKEGLENILMLQRRPSCPPLYPAIL